MLSDSKKDDSRNQAIPFLFVLKEGPSYDKNPFDYNLCIMHMRAENLMGSSLKISISAKNKYDTHISALEAK